MRLLDLTLEAPEQDLALDEAILDEAEAAPDARETLRLWEAARPMVVLGRSSDHQVEVNEAVCHERGVPILRRASGGATVMAGPGCLMYAVVLSYELRPELRSIDQTHRFVLDTLLSALRPLAPDAVRRGTSDLARGDFKFSGNALRCKRKHVLYHGTLLYDFPISLLSECLRTPPRQPEYRRGRPHAQFVANLPISVEVLRQAVIGAWHVDDIEHDWPRERVQDLVAARYSQRGWIEGSGAQRGE